MGPKPYAARRKLLEHEVLRMQAKNNTKAQFAASPTFDDELINARRDALSAHESMSSHGRECKP